MNLAERRAGCTPADMRAANEGPTLADVLEDWHAEDYVEKSVDDIRRAFTEWHFATVA
jgi:hypothetical protein